VSTEELFSATSLGIYANDLTYDPDATEAEYLEASERGNVFQLVWRMEMDAGVVSYRRGQL